MTDASVVSQTGRRTSDFRWTVLVLMGANNPSSEEDLAEEAEEDLAEMRSVGAAAALNVLVQLHGRDTTVREHIGHDRHPHPILLSNLSHTDGSALLDFMEWGVAEAGHQTQDRLLLVLWGHAYDFAIGRTETPTGVDGLDFAELSGTLREFTERHDRRIDIVGFDACQVSTIEMAYELRHVADYLLSSQIGVPLPGWPYDRILNRLKTPIGQRMGPAELGSYIVRRYCEHYHAMDRTVTLTMLDLGCAERLVAKTEALARTLALALDGDRNEANALARLMSRAMTMTDEPFVDVAELCVTLLRDCPNLAVRLAAEDVGDLLLSPAPVPGGQSLQGVGRPFIVEHGRNACETARLHGVSLHVPHVAPDRDTEAARAFYDKFSFVSHTMWADVVRALR